MCDSCYSSSACPLVQNCPHFLLVCYHYHVTALNCPDLYVITEDEPTILFNSTGAWYFLVPSSYSKMFDIELCPLPFSMEEMFGFISCRFSGYPASVQEQALLWLHVSSARTHTHTPSCVPLASCGSVHSECELNRLSQSVRVWAGALQNVDLGHRMRLREPERILPFILYALTACGPVCVDQFQVFCRIHDQVIALICPH